MRNIILPVLCVIFYAGTSRGENRQLTLIENIHNVTFSDTGMDLTIHSVYETGKSEPPSMIELPWNTESHMLKEINIVSGKTSYKPHVIFGKNSLLVPLQGIDKQDGFILNAEIYVKPLLENLSWYEMVLKTPRDEMHVRFDTGGIFYYPGDTGFIITKSAKNIRIVKKPTHKGRFIVSNRGLPGAYLKTLREFFYNSPLDSFDFREIFSAEENSSIERTVQKWIVENIEDNDEEIIHYLPPMCEVLLKTRKGNCLDRTYLAFNILRKKGINAYPVLFYEKSPPLTPGDFIHSAILIEDAKSRSWMDLYGVHLRRGVRGIVLKKTGNVSTEIRMDDVIIW